MKINETIIDGDIDKAVSHSQGNAFELEDVSMTVVDRTQVQPRLFTALFSGEANTVNLETKTIKYDDLQETLQIPDGKAYQAYGNDLQKDKPRQLIYEVGSFGLRWNVAPMDYANKRVPGTNDLMDEAYVMTKMAAKADKAWNLFNELKWVQLLTTDTNITRNGPMPQYNYYTDVLGVARPAATDMDLGGTGDIFQAFNFERDKLMEDADKTLNTVDMVVVICGTTFFNKRLEVERQETLARNLRTQLDLASMPVPRSNFGEGTSGMLNYQFFDSEIDGLRYIRYSGSIQGTNLIGDDDAYMIPLGCENFVRDVFAPAQTRTYVNTSAQARYAWAKEHEREGVVMAQESNTLPMSINPQLVRHLTSVS